MDSIRAFSGPDPTVANVEPEAQAILLSFDRTVTHHDLVYAGDDSALAAPWHPDRPPWLC
jgi:hypothetical protein